MQQYEADVLNCKSKTLPNCKMSGNYYDQTTKKCVCNDCVDNFKFVNNYCQDFEQMNKCVVDLQGTSTKEIP